MSSVKRSMIATITQGGLETKASESKLPVSMEMYFTDFIKGEKGDKGDDGEQGPKGDNGLNGADGRDGIDGRDGERGNKWFVGTNFSSLTNLIDGDLFLNSSTFDVYRLEVTGTAPSSSTAWILVGNIKGSIDPSILAGYVSKTGQQTMAGALLVNGGTTGAYSQISKNEVSVNEVPTGSSDRSCSLGFKTENGIKKAVLRWNANGNVKEIKLEDIERIMNDIDTIKSALVEHGIM